MASENDKKVLPHDLLTCEKKLLDALITFLKFDDSKRISVDLRFEGLKLFPLVFRLVDGFNVNSMKSYILFSDIGSASLAKRDYPNQANQIFTYKQLLNEDIFITNSNVLAVSPQPYDYDLYNDVCSKISVPIIMINGRLEETTIGVGFVGRERRNTFIKSWKNAFYIQPLNKGALYMNYPNQWLLFKYTKIGYIYLEMFDKKPDPDTISELLS